jgi:hypothetical protein
METTRDIEQKAVEMMENEMDGLNIDQRDSVLQTLYQTQVVREKYGLIKKDKSDISSAKEEEDNRMLEFMELLEFPIDDDLEYSEPEVYQSTDIDPSENPMEFSTYSLLDVPRPTYCEKNLANPAQETDTATENGDGDGPDSEYIRRVRKVTVDVQGWAVKTLDEHDVDLEEYISVKYHGNAKKTLKIDPVKVEEVKVASNAFRAELEAALVSWTPQFLNNSKGKMVSVVSENLAPSGVMGNLSKTYDIKLESKTILRDPAKVGPSASHHKHKYGLWYMPPKTWSSHWKDTIENLESKNKKKETFVQSWLKEISCRSEIQTIHQMAGKIRGNGESEVLADGSIDGTATPTGTNDAHDLAGSMANFKKTSRRNTRTYSGNSSTSSLTRGQSNSKISGSQVNLERSNVQNPMETLVEH